MLIYLLTCSVILLIWRVKDYFSSDIYKDYSTTAVPQLKNSFRLALRPSDEIFLFPRNCAKKFGRSYRNKFFGRLGYNICRAKDAEKILGSSKHIEKSRLYNLLHSFLKTGLLTSKGEKWHSRRRMLTPTFHFEILKEFFDIFNEESQKLVELLKPEIGRKLNIIPVSTQFTLHTVCGEILMILDNVKLS